MEVWDSLLCSRLGVNQLSELYRACKNGVEAEEGVRMGEWFVETVEALEDDRETREAAKRKAAQIAADAAQANGITLPEEAIVVGDEVEGGTKGLEVIKKLLVCQISLLQCWTFSFFSALIPLCSDFARYMDSAGPFADTCRKLPISLLSPQP